MEIATAAVGIACAAFLITQVHLWRVARKLIAKSESSWAQARTTIFESSRAIHNDVVAEIQKLEQKSGPEGLKTAFAELDARVNSLPGLLDDKILKLNGGIRESFISFGDQLGKNLESLIPKTPQRVPFGGDTRGAQSNSADARRVNQIVKTLEVGVGTGGNLIGAVNEVAGLLEQFGSPDLADWLHDNPDKLPMIYQTIQRNPRLAQGLAKFEQKLAGQMPGNGGFQSQGQSQGGMAPGVNR